MIKLQVYLQDQKKMVNTQTPVQQLKYRIKKYIVNVILYNKFLQTFELWSLL